MPLRDPTIGGPNQPRRAINTCRTIPSAQPTMNRTNDFPCTRANPNAVRRRLIEWPACTCEPNGPRSPDRGTYPIFAAGTAKQTRVPRGRQTARTISGVHVRTRARLPNGRIKLQMILHKRIMPAPGRTRAPASSANLRKEPERRPAQAAAGARASAGSSSSAPRSASSTCSHQTNSSPCLAPSGISS